MVNMIFFVILVISITFIFYFNEKISNPKQLYIPAGSIKKIVAYLNKKLPNSFSKVDRYLIQYFGSPQSGWIQLSNNNLKRWQFLKELTKAKAISFQKVTLIPGETTKYFIYQLAKKNNLDFEELYNYFLEISPIAEGFLIPDTYYINQNNNKKRFLKKLIIHAKKIHRKYIKIFNIQNFEEYKKILIIASIIQKESGNNEEMKYIASVIYNRLEKGMKLQMDGTLNYGLYSHQKITSSRIREDNSQFNTYKIKGLPKVPICNPSLKAIEAAINPINTDYLYFVRVPGKNYHIFSKTYHEHSQNIKR